jgi:hypothetical protein
MSWKSEKRIIWKLQTSQRTQHLYSSHWIFCLWAHEGEEMRDGISSYKLKEAKQDRISYSFFWSIPRCISIKNISWVLQSTEITLSIGVPYRRMSTSLIHRTMLSQGFASSFTARVEWSTNKSWIRRPSWMSTSPVTWDDRNESNLAFNLND